MGSRTTIGKYLNISVKVKVKVFRYKPEVALGDPVG
jgi:hypothetical protein